MLRLGSLDTPLFPSSDLVFLLGWMTVLCLGLVLSSFADKAKFRVLSLEGLVSVTLRPRRMGLLGGTPRG